MSMKTVAMLSIVAVAVSYFYLISKPNIAIALWSEDYKQLMYACDQSMREHYIAKMAVEVDVSDTNLNNLKASELGLMTCHDYDKSRKKLISWGVSENMLSIIGLEAIEEKEYDLDKFVEIHEFQY